MRQHCRFVLQFCQAPILSPLSAQSDKNVCTERGKGGMGIIVWTKIGYHHVCMMNTDNEHEGIANIIEARNKCEMLCTRKRRIGDCTVALL